MRQRLVCATVCILFCCLATVASAQELTEGLIGTWSGDKAKTEELLKADKVDEEEIKRIVDEISKVKLVINEDKTFSVKEPSAPDDFGGSWVVKKEDEAKKEVVLTLKLKVGGQENPMDFTFTIMKSEGELKYVKIVPEGQKPAIFSMPMKK